MRLLGQFSTFYLFLQKDFTSIGAPNQKLTSVLSFYGTVRRLSSIYIKYLKR